MSEQVNSEEVLELEPEWLYDIKTLTNTYRGVRCPNPDCSEEIYSTRVYLSEACSCGLTWVAGGDQFLKYGVGAPYTLADVEVVAQHGKITDLTPTLPDAALPEVEATEEVSEEEIAQIPETNPDPNPETQRAVPGDNNGLGCQLPPPDYRGEPPQS